MSGDGSALLTAVLVCVSLVAGLILVAVGLPIGQPGTSLAVVEAVAAAKPSC